MELSDTVEEKNSTCCVCVGRMTRDYHFRQKWIYTICIFFAFVSIGWMKAQFGPSFLDLLFISNTTLEDGSWFVTVFSIGYVVGSAIGGALYNAVNKTLLMCVSLLLLSAVHVVIPWCYLIWMMLASHFVKGLFTGILDSVGCAEIVRLWKDKSRPFLMGVNILSSVGSVISPLITSPFLLQKPSTVLSVNQSNNTTPYIESTTANATTPYSESVTSNIFFAYIISAAMCATIAFPLFFLVCSSQKDGTSLMINKAKETSITIRTLPRSIQIMFLVAFGFLIGFFSAIDEGYIAYLSTFCVEYFDWTKSDAAFIMSVMFVTLLVSRLSMLFIMKYANTILLNGVLSFLIFVDMLGFALVSIYRYNIGVWLFGALFGVAKCASFPLLMSWLNEYILPVTGKVSSFCMMVSMVSSALNPLLLGYLMEEVSTISFVFLFLVESVVLLLLFFITALLTKCVTNRYGLTYNRSDKTVIIDELEKLH